MYLTHLLYSAMMEVVGFLRLALVVVFSISVVLAVVGGIQYFRARHHPVIRARQPLLTLLNIAVLILTMASFDIDTLAQPSCAHILSSHMFFITLALDIHLLRGWITLLNWNKSKALSKDSGEGNWWLIHAYMGRSAFFAKVAGFGVLIHIIGWLAVVRLNGVTESFNYPAPRWICTSSLLWIIGVWLPLCLQTVLSCFLSLQLRQVTDVFRVRIELIRTGAIWVISIFPWLTALSFFPKLESIEWYSYM